MANGGKKKKPADNEIFSYSPQARKAANKERMKTKAGNFPWKGTIAIALSVLMFFLGTGMIIFYSTISSVNFKDIGSGGSKVVNQSGIEELENVSIDVYSGELLNDPMILNVMLFGEDNRKDGEEQGRSDTMLMLSVDNRHKKLKLTSFMRDMLVTIPGVNDAGQSYGLDKLNASYTYGGPELTIKTIESNFGIDIDRYAVVDFESFKNIIDTLGGIDIELTQDEIDYINFQTYINGQSDERYEITDEPGMIHLNGRQALWYSRDRGYQDESHPEFVVSGDDFDRTARQRNLLRTLMRNLKKANLGQIVNIVGQIGPMITTNLKKDEITTLVANSLTYLSYDFAEYRLPVEGYYQYDWYNDQSVLVITDWDATRYEMAKFVFEDSVIQNMPTSDAEQSQNGEGQYDDANDIENYNNYDADSVYE